MAGPRRFFRFIEVSVSSRAATVLAVKLRGRFYLFVAGVLLLAFFAGWWRRAHLESSQDKNILAASRKHGVDPALIKAGVWGESRFRPEAKGGKGETGLMQIMEDTGKEWAAAQHIPMFTKHLLRDPAKNIDCGARSEERRVGK